MRTSALPAKFRESVIRARRIGTLFDAIKYGDDDHREWLKEAIEAHFDGRAVPPTRGKGLQQ